MPRSALLHFTVPRFTSPRRVLSRRHVIRISLLEKGKEKKFLVGTDTSVIQLYYHYRALSMELWTTHLQHTLANANSCHNRSISAGIRGSPFRPFTKFTLGK